MTTNNLTAYLKTGEHLPPELRDFHDQKLFFKWLVWDKLTQTRKQLTESDQPHSTSVLDGINFVNAQVFTLDYFLWFMAMFGYKLQRIRKNDLQFYDLSAAMKEYRERLTREQAAILREGLDRIKSGNPPTQP